MKLSPEALARASSRHPWRTIGIWVVVIVSMGIVSSRLLGDVLNQEFEFTNRPESVRAQEVLDEKFETGGAEDTEFVIVQSETLTVEDPAFREAVTDLQQAIAALDGEILASPPTSYYDVAQRSPEQAAGLVSRDQRATLIMVSLKDTELSTIEELRSLAAEGRPDGFTVQVAGQGVMFADFTEIAEEDLRRGEMIGGIIALIVLIVVLAAIVAAVAPIVMAIFAIAVALGLVSLIGQLYEFNLFVTNMVSMIGLAVGHRLLVVHRVPVPGGAEEGVPQARGDRCCRRYGEPGGVLQRADGGHRPAGDADHPGQHLPQSGVGGDPGHPGVAGGVDDPAPGDPRSARRPGQLASAGQASPDRFRPRS
jgi:RND superfamily putative drug exporter